jgi:hypothetical protein
MRAVRAPLDELAEFSRRSTHEFQRGFIAMASARAREHAGLSWRDEHRRALNGVAEAIGQTMTIANLYGRRRVWLEVDAAESRSFAHSPIVPKVAFAEAVADIIRREARLATSAADIARIYQEGGFALAESADIALTRRIQEIVAQSIARGTPELSAAALVREAGDFTAAYADTVYRTNLSTAYTAGRFEQARDPDVQRAMPAMERTSVRDSAVRRGRPEDHGENHLAADGLVAATDDVIWEGYRPPSGFRCRCAVRLVSVAELRRRGLMDGDRVVRFEPPGLSAFRAHPSFQGVSWSI